ncbi:MetQ/NlpA family ABC transporter substrate-binding protein [Acidisoma silvae]|uniref:Metal ABC transporter substrate-binding protein n=1 Tax=Acidisoma silvae TaxID=2802396 RepID=A0A963YQK7_9PROT|nr:MetQ/NlpA family ABC transporter substrate-binding protein [Acidisoma silvae]MCB8875155.1 metal ABC transporter substrate-binding protein [Acidisoma silvae]
MAASGEFEIETQPGLARRMLVAGAIAVALCVVGLIASANAAEPLTIAATPGPMADVVQHAADLAKKQGLPVKVIVFSDWVTPNVAVNEGSVEANFYEHKPFLAVAVKARGFKLVAVAPGVIMPVGLFSHKVKSLADVKDGAQVAVANDPVNRARGLQLFAKAGLITLKPGVGDAATVHDITANPKHLHFIELPAPQLVRALDDVTVAQVSYSFFLASGGDPKTALISDSTGNKHYAIQFVARPQDATDPKLLEFIKIFQSDDERAYLTQKYGTAVMPAW